MTTYQTDICSVSLLGTGHAVPERVVSSRELDQQLNHRPGTLEKVGGVRQRHFASNKETAASLAARAALQALAAAGLDIADIDCLVAASGTMDQGMPCNAALIHKELGLSSRGIPAFDINASCLGFLAALDTMAWPIVAGRYQRVLIVAADITSCGLDWSKLESSAIFGDGAAAAIVGPGINAGSRLIAAQMNTLSEGVNLCRIPGGGTRYHAVRTGQPSDELCRFMMDGKAVFKLATTHLPGFIERLLEQAQLSLDQLDWIVPHQASHLALSHITRRLGMASNKVINIFADYGNQVAASLPTALDIAIRDGRIQRGHRLLLLGTGAGVSLGGIILEY